MEEHFNAFAGVAMLLVDPEQCPQPEDFDKSLMDDYMFYAIGGNHSICARADLAVEKPLFEEYHKV